MLSLSLCYAHCMAMSCRDCKLSITLAADAKPRPSAKSFVSCGKHGVDGYWSHHRYPALIASRTTAVEVEGTACFGFIYAAVRVGAFHALAVISTYAIANTLIIQRTESARPLWLYQYSFAPPWASCSFLEADCAHSAVSNCCGSTFPLRSALFKMP